MASEYAVKFIRRHRGCECDAVLGYVCHSCADMAPLVEAAFLEGVRIGLEAAARRCINPPDYVVDNMSASEKVAFEYAGHVLAVLNPTTVLREHEERSDG